MAEATAAMLRFDIGLRYPMISDEFQSRDLVLGTAALVDARRGAHASCNAVT